jgi:tetratricopeptide (TPR) repeat protein
MLRRIRPLLALALLLLLVLPPSDGAQLPPGPHQNLRSADALFLSGRYYEALPAYQRIDADTLPLAALRLGMLRLIRGEFRPAERAIRAAMQAGLAPADYQLALLYLGQTLVGDGRSGLAGQTWALMDDCRSPEACAYRAPAHVLLAEDALRRGDFTAAEADYSAALAVPLPQGWADLATYRLALLRAAHDPAAASAMISPVAPRPNDTVDAFLAPLLPADSAWQGQLAAALTAQPEQSRPQLLGQLYLSQGLYGLAEAQFAQVPAGTYARSAAVYAAYARWLADDRTNGLAQLEQIVAQRPDDPQARMILALAYLATDSSVAAYDQIDALAHLSPSDPDIHLAWANWYAASHDYPQASQEYALALEQARAEQRGRYALLGARFHLATTYELCISGMALAQAAVAALPSDSAAGTVLAAHQYYCDQPADAVASAQRAVESGGGAESVYYLGVALAALGQSDSARSALIRAADLAPASVWRERAETALALMP